MDSIALPDRELLSTFTQSLGPRGSQTRLQYVTCDCPTVTAVKLPSSRARSVAHPKSKKIPQGDSSRDGFGITYGVGGVATGVFATTAAVRRFVFAVIASCTACSFAGFV